MYTTPITISARVEVAGPQSISAEVSSSTITAEGGAAVEVSSASPYRGAYEVTPSGELQVLATRGLMATRDVIVNPIPSNYGRIEFDGSTLSVI